MPYESLQAVIGTAVIDSKFRIELLNNSRRHAIQKFDLTKEEMEAVMSIRADSLEQFAGQLDQWISKALGKAEPPRLTLDRRRNL